MNQEETIPRGQLAGAETQNRKEIRGKSTSLAFQSLVIKVKVVLQVFQHFHLLLHVLKSETINKKVLYTIYIKKRKEVKVTKVNKASNLNSLPDVLKVVFENLLLLRHHCPSGVSSLTVLNGNRKNSSKVKTKSYSNNVRLHP